MQVVRLTRKGKFGSLTGTGIWEEGKAKIESSIPCFLLRLAEVSMIGQSHLLLVSPLFIFSFSSLLNYSWSLFQTLVLQLELKHCRDVKFCEGSWMERWTKHNWLVGQKRPNQIAELRPPIPFKLYTKSRIYNSLYILNNQDLLSTLFELVLLQERVYETGQRVKDPIYTFCRLLLITGSIFSSANCRGKSSGEAVNRRSLGQWRPTKMRTFEKMKSFHSHSPRILSIPSSIAPPPRSWCTSSPT